MTGSVTPNLSVTEGCSIYQRYVVGFMGFFALANGYIQRFCLSLAITEMVIANSSHTAKFDPNACPADPSLVVVNGTTLKDAGEFTWNEEVQGMILSAFFWGYVVMQVPGGLLAERFGSKIALGFGMLTSTAATILTPFVARTWSYTGLIVLRFILGLGQGSLYPSLNVLLANWAPTQERGRMGAIVFAGAQIGNVLSMALSGILVSYGGWTLVFYFFGGLGLVWTILWKILVYSTPADHPFISQAELNYIQATSGKGHLGHETVVTPWRHILTSVPFWALVMAQIGHDWGLFTIITDLPKYMKSVMHFSTTQNGFLSAAPYFAMWLFALISGWIVDWMVNARHINVTTVRKLFVTIASMGPAFGILAATYSGCDRILVVFFFTAGMGVMGAFVPSLKVNSLDLSPNHAGTLMALVGGIGAISGALVPYLVGYLTPNSTLLEWRVVFWISVIVMCITNVVYVIFGSAEVQPWNELKTDNLSVNEALKDDKDSNVKLERL